MKPEVIIENEVYRKVMHWVNKSQYEVSGLGMVRVEENGVLRVVSAILLPQKNGSAHTDIEAEDVNKALFQLKDSEGMLRWWWHSHVQMGVFWSGTDHDTIKKIGAGGWFAASVFNQKKEVKSCYYGAHDQKTPWGTSPLMLDDLKTTLSAIVEDTTEWDKEYELNVTNQIRTPAVVYGGKNGMTMGRGGTAATGTNIDWDKVVDVEEEPPLVRPFEMPARVYKRWKKMHKSYKEVLKKSTQTTFDMRKASIEKIDAGNGKLVDLDDYGFDGADRTLLGEEGWTDQDIDDLLEDFSPADIMRFVKLGVSKGEIEYLSVQLNYTHEEVMELVQQSEAYGINMFNQPGTWRNLTNE